MYRITRDLRADDYDRAVAFARAGGELKVAALIRHFGDIGYNAAATLMERMEAEGIVTRCNHVGQRTLVEPPQ